MWWIQTVRKEVNVLWRARWVVRRLEVCVVDGGGAAISFVDVVGFDMEKVVMVRW